MIVLIGFPDVERTFTEKAFVELGIDDRCKFFDTLEGVFEFCAQTSDERRTATFPRVFVFNIDVPGETWKSDLTALKSTNGWKSIPAIGYGFLTDQSDIPEFYAHGGVSCIRKATSYEELLESTRTAMGYWLGMSTMPCDYLKEA